MKQSHFLILIANAVAVWGLFLLGVAVWDLPLAIAAGAAVGVFLGSLKMTARYERKAGRLR